MQKAREPDSEKKRTFIKQSVYEFGRRKHSFTVLARDLIWKFARWESAQLNQWIDDFSPDLVFLTAGEYQFAYRMGLKIAKTRSIPIIIFIGDDVYVIPGKSFSPFFWINKFLLRRTMRESFDYASAFVSTCDAMGQEYGKLFDIDYSVFPTGCQHFAEFPEASEKSILTISYIGNILSFNRWITLRMIGEALQRLNINGVKAVLNLYSTERLDSAMLKQLNITDSMKYMGGLESSGVRSVIENSDILLHVESMDETNRRLTRLSFSTKIPQYLGSGKCLLAVGPAEAASIRYFKDNHAGCVVTDYAMLDKALASLVSDTALRQRLASRALSLAHERYDSTVNSKLFLAMIEEIVAKSKISR